MIIYKIVQHDLKKYYEINIISNKQKKEIFIRN